MIFDNLLLLFKTVNTGQIMIPGNHFWITMQKAFLLGRMSTAK